MTTAVAVFVFGFCLASAVPQDAKPKPEEKKPAAKQEGAGPKKPGAESFPDAGAPDEKSKPKEEAKAEPVLPARPPGAYLGIGWVLAVLLPCMLWVLLADWLNRDAHALGLRREWWNLLMFCAGMGGIVFFWFGHAAFVCAPLVFALIVCLLYLPARNRHVQPSQQIWTREHIRLKLIGALRRVGIHVNTRTFLRGRVPGQEIMLLGAGGQAVGLPKIDGPKEKAEEGISCIKEIVDGAIKRRATVIDLQPRGELLHVRYQIDGVFYDRGTYSWELNTPIMQCTKAISGLDITGQSGARVGGFAVGLPDRMVAIRTAVELSVQGEAISLRLLDPARAILRLDKIGLPDETLREVRKLIEEKSGLILVCSPGEGGRTTTLYSMIAEINLEKRKVVTIEHPIEFRLKSVTQFSVNEKREQPFPKVLQAAIAQKPDVLVIGDLDGKAGAHAALREANEGRLVLAAMRADSAVEGLQRLFEWGADSNVVGGAVRAIIAQRLIRKLCPACRRPFKPSEDLLKKISVTPESAEKLFKAVGCAKCMKTGFIGRTGIFELLEITDKMRAMIGSETPVSDVLAEAQRSGHGHIWDDGVTKLLEGVTSIQELVRVTKSK